jgi:hypothetical protein
MLVTPSYVRPSSPRLSVLLRECKLCEKGSDLFSLRPGPVAVDGELLRAHCKRRCASAGDQACEINGTAITRRLSARSREVREEIPSGPPPEFLLRVCAMSAKEFPVCRRQLGENKSDPFSPISR